MDDIIVRHMKLEDIDQICEIEQQAFTTPWTKDAFYNEMVNNLFAFYIVLEAGGLIVGYAGMWTVVDEAHVTNIAIREGYRGKGLGDRLLTEMKSAARALGMMRMTLEVRVSNEVAQSLYAKHDFKSVGIRKRYYTDNHEDAMIMWVELHEQPSHNRKEQET